MLALHLLQSALVHVNTLLLQRVLDDPSWAARLGVDDQRGLTPLFWSNIDPYGRFSLDMDTRLTSPPPPRSRRKPSRKPIRCRDGAIAVALRCSSSLSPAATSSASWASATPERRARTGLGQLAPPSRQADHLPHQPSYVVGRGVPVQQPPSLVERQCEAREQQHGIGRRPRQPVAGHLRPDQSVP